MLRGKKPPERLKVRHWETLPLKQGGTLVGYIAGPAILVHSHTTQRSKPCLKSYHGESVQCVGCTQQLRLCFIAYQPFYCAITDHEKVAVFHEDMFARLDSYSLHQRVTIGRPELGKNPGLWIRSEKGKYTSARQEHQGEADIADWLIVLWRMHGVMTPDEIRGGPLPAAVTPECHTPAPSVTSAEKAYRDAPPELRHRMAAMISERRAKGLPEIPFAEVVDRLGASRNGDGKD